jgi:hypothetical protein
MRIVFLCSLIIMSGCAVSQQKFIDISYNPDGTMLREVRGKSTTVAPPFGSKAISDHNLHLDESAAGWLIQMGSRADLEGGDLTPEMISAIRLMLMP